MGFPFNRRWSFTNQNKTTTESKYGGSSFLTIFEKVVDNCNFMDVTDVKIQFGKKQETDKSNTV